MICVSVNTITATAAAAADDDDDDDDASQCDVIAPHPEHLLLVNLGPCSTKRLIFSLDLSVFISRINMVARQSEITIYKTEVDKHKNQTQNHS